MQTTTLRLILHQPTKAKQAVYRELAVRVTGLANNLVAAGRPKKLTSKTAKPYCPDQIPSAVINQALREVCHRDCTRVSGQRKQKHELLCA